MAAVCEELVLYTPQAGGREWEESFGIKSSVNHRSEWQGLKGKGGESRQHPTVMGDSSVESRQDPCFALFNSI